MLLEWILCMLSILSFQFILKPALSTSHKKELHCLSFLFQLALVHFKSGKNCQDFLQCWKTMTKETLFQVHVSNQNVSFHVAEAVKVYGCD